MVTVMEEIAEMTFEHQVNAAPKDGLVVVAEKLDNGLTGSDEEEVLTIWYERDTQAHAGHAAMVTVMEEIAEMTFEHHLLTIVGTGA
jgi:hypothetical protein